MRKRSATKQQVNNIFMLWKKIHAMRYFSKENAKTYISFM